MAEWLKRRPDWVVGDFGCGEAELARLVPNKVYSFDHVAVNQFVIVCDMAATGLPDRTLDVAVFALSLMGVNYHDYLREAFRLLRYGGWLKVAEPATRWGEGKLEELLDAITSCGFSMVGQPQLPRPVHILRCDKIVGETASPRRNQRFESPQSKAKQSGRGKLGGQHASQNDVNRRHARLGEHAWSDHQCLGGRTVGPDFVPGNPGTLL